MNGKRTPVTAASVGNTVIVVCDDGSAWRLTNDDRWIEAAPIPDSSRFYEKNPEKAPEARSIPIQR